MFFPPVECPASANHGTLDWRMSALKDDSSPQPGGGEWFTTTHWSVVLAAGQTANPTAGEALEKLCRAYWYPLYAYVRRLGHAEDTAKDLTQAFFARLLEKNYVGQADRQRGRFRSFLLGALKHFLADEWDKAQALKRGGGLTVLSLDDDTADERYRLEPADEASPDKLFDRRWALATLEQAAKRLRCEYHEAGKGELFDRLQDFLSGDLGGSSYSEGAALLGMTENTLKSHGHRLRQRNRELLRRVIADTVASCDQIEEELNDLFAAVASL
jgi:DNA-directed RNA polymerase specialized sigma24 family protein